MILAVDTETTGVDPFHGCRPFMITACDGATNWIFETSVNPFTRQVEWEQHKLDEVQDLLDEAETLVLHNTKFDFRMLSYIGIEIEHLWAKTHDTLIASHCICSGEPHGLKELAFKYLDFPPREEKELEEAVKAARTRGRKDGWDIAREGHPHFPGTSGTLWKGDFWMAPEQCRRYATGDVERTWALWAVYEPELRNTGLWRPYLTRRALLPVTYALEERGMYFHYNAATAAVEDIQATLNDYTTQIKSVSNYRYALNLESPKDLSHLLYTHLKLPVLERTPTGKPSTASNVIDDLIEVTLDSAPNSSGLYDEPEHPLELFHNYRKLRTRQKYTEGYLKWATRHPNGHFIHSLLNITGTRNTRQSSASPNQQNLDSYQKQFFGPPPGYVWLDADLVNIELKIWATLTKEPALMESFALGKSVHLMIAEILHPSLFSSLSQPSEFPTFYPDLYRSVKGGNFASIYGATPAKINATYGVPNGYEMVSAHFPGIRKFTEDCISEVSRNREIWGQSCIFTLGKYRLSVPTDEPFKAVNYKIQGTAGEIMGAIMLALHNALPPDYYLVCQVHDSIIIEIPDTPDLSSDIARFIDIIETAYPLLDYSCSHKIITHKSPSIQNTLPPSLPF